MNHVTHPRRWLLAAAGLGGVLLIFGACVVGGTLVLRSRLQRQALQQEAKSMESLVMLQLDAQASDVDRIDLAGTEAGAFGAVLDSSRMRGVIAVRLFDGRGELVSCLPGTAVDAELSADLASAARDQGEARARLYPNSPLADHLGTEGLVAGSTRGSLLEVVVPIPQASSGTGLPIAQYWMDGTPLAEAFAAMDRQLAGQASVVFLAGSAAIALCLAWVYRRLVAAERVLEARTLDLARANAELVFAAKTSAVGAISAHLVHGLKNPVAGIDGFLADALSGGEPAGQGEALREARETTRRITELLHDVSTILKEEGEAPIVESIRLGELMTMLAKNAGPRAEHAGVVLRVSAEGDAEIDGRTGSLCRLALQNLIENAIDATPRGRKVGVVARCDAEGRVAIDVSDEGPGFTADERERLFQPKRSSKAGGSGLGLAISWHLVRHVDGDLKLIETGTFGSKFRLSFQSKTVCI